jgi:hypothetical protein
MLDVDCERCGRVLIGTRQILSLTSSPSGIEVAYVCGCGRPGVLLTGRAAAEREYEPTHARQE